MFRMPVRTSLCPGCAGLAQPAKSNAIMPREWSTRLKSPKFFDPIVCFILIPSRLGDSLASVVPEVIATAAPF
jgi:hypothetical protein